MSQETNPTKTSLTMRETELAVIALQALKNDGKVDVGSPRLPSTLISHHVSVTMGLLLYVCNVALYEHMLTAVFQLDDDKFAQMAGYGTTNSARVCFANLKRKLNAATVNAYYVAAGTGGTPKATPKKPRAKAASKSKLDSPVDDSPTKRKEYPTEETTPAKRSKADGYVKKEEVTEESPNPSDSEANH